MPNYRSKEEGREFKAKVLCAAAKLFLEKGYAKSSIREIAEEAGVHISSLKQFFGLKENVLAELVEQALEWQFRETKRMLVGITDDPILFYAAETTLQLYIVESDENIRDIYTIAYSLPITAKIIREAMTTKLEDIFKEYLPDLEGKDFFEREIASGGIIRGFMSIPCGRYFTMERKITAFLESVFKIYDLSKEKTKEAVEFVMKLDYESIVSQCVDSMLERLVNELT